MTLDEARDVARACRDATYPPTNPTVLLRAAVVLRRERFTLDYVNILAWLLQVESTNQPVALAPFDELRPAIVSLQWSAWAAANAVASDPEGVVA
jgi:hypothetical protein